MKGKITILLAIAGTLVLGSCKKQETANTTGESTQALQEVTEERNPLEVYPEDKIPAPTAILRNQTTNADVKIAKKVEGEIIETIDEDILERAVENYYDLSNANLVRHRIAEYVAYDGTCYHDLRGVIKKGSQRVYFSVQLLEIEIEGKDYLYIPVVGFEQNLRRVWGNMYEYNFSYSTSYADEFGSNGLIREIHEIQ